jgi:pimeloyl-ACP methyl ester carboxylesterase
VQKLELEARDGTAVYAEVYGTGPGLMLSHGFGGSARNFRRQARELESGYKVVLLDTRGHARSGAPEQADAYCPDRLVDDLVLSSDVAGTPVIVGGLSMGAGLSERFALRYPEKTRAVVLLSPPRGGPENQAWALGLAAAIEERGIDAAGEDFVWGGRSRFDRAGAELIRQGFREHSPHGLVHILRQVLAEERPAEERAPALAKLELPLLIVVGSNDRSSLAAGEVLARGNARAHLVVIPGAGHVVNLAAPEEVLSALREFLGSLDRTA